MNLEIKLRICSVLLIICLSTFLQNSIAAPKPNEENCRAAITAGLEQLRQIPPDLTRRDDEDRKKLLEAMERLVEANRRKGIGECETWRQMMRKAFNQ